MFPLVAMTLCHKRPFGVNVIKLSVSIVSRHANAHSSKNGLAATGVVEQTHTHLIVIIAHSLFCT